ncbi:MAG: cation-translocating P-type ATPase [Anaerolineaceae bacterium]|nr:cation-translocating P-type ATPase [Anaerolineaceae bacterium]
MTEELKDKPTIQKDALEVSWYALEPKEVLAKLDVPENHGLRAEEAARRLEKIGPNELEQKKGTSFLQMLWAQINNFVIWLLIIASVISFALGDGVEAAAILLIVVLNAVMGIIQESRAEKSLAALKKMAAPEAQVMRDGSRQTVPTSQLVPGDLVFIEAGNFIPADIRLLEAVNLSIDEASLTGESVPSKKNATSNLESDIPIGDRENSAFMGTVATYGRGKGVVTTTGMKTQLGLIAKMLQSVDEEQTPLQKRLEQLGKTLAIGALLVCGLVFVIGAIRIIAAYGGIHLDNPEVQKGLAGVFMIAVSLAIAAVPEGLPAVVTISLAGGMREMVNRHALIRRLASVETLGSVTTICTDKTGTLTQNQMTVTRLWVNGRSVSVTGTGYEPKGEFLLNEQKVDLKDLPGVRTALWVGTLNNDARLEMSGESDGNPSYRMIGDPTEGSILVAARKAGSQDSALWDAYPREEEIPFDSERKRMVTVHSFENPQESDLSPFSNSNNPKGYVVAVKGAPDIVLNLCTEQLRIDNSSQPLTNSLRREILSANDEMASKALRVIAVAYRIVKDAPEHEEIEKIEKDLTFVGLVGMIDPSRPEVKPAMTQARNAGIRSVMITGDYPNTAKAIAEDIGLLQPGHQVLTGSDLDKMSEEELNKAVGITDVYARVSPEHKMRIVDALRANGEVVAMTGDGVNDAPAIKKADIGVAMGITGTDVAKETADMVLTDDNYASIVHAVEQGRIIYSNIRKFVYYLISCNIGEIMIIFLATLFGWTAPLTAIQLLWLNLVTDGAPALALGVEKGDPDIMQQPPRPPSEPIINKFMRNGIIVQTIAITSAVLGAYLIGLHQGGIQEAETFAFVTLSFSELLRAFTARSEYYPLTKIGIFSNSKMNLAVFSSMILVLVTIYVPPLQEIFNTMTLQWHHWLEILPFIFVPAVTAEIMKALTYKKQMHKMQA